jgi:hypothetical protein
VISPPDADARRDEAVTRAEIRPDLNVAAGQRSSGARLPVRRDLVPALLYRNVQTRADVVPAKMTFPVLDLGKLTYSNRWWPLVH